MKFLDSLLRKDSAKGAAAPLSGRYTTAFTDREARSALDAGLTQTELRALFMSPITKGRTRSTGGAWPFGGHSPHLWCPKCQRAFPNGTFRLRTKVRTCPYGDCQCREREALGWPKVQVRYPDLPVTPRLGVRYGFQAAPMST